ncbi:hypothetical protein ABGB17_34025 [Sphaerisporangium sp. B11E5]|uniref:hypothetical protein n=1 Tax=Sphaerisporangium sp. B11E5 TaxID=3153563 RepID=UPI00325EFFAB
MDLAVVVFDVPDVPAAPLVPLDLPAVVRDVPPAARERVVPDVPVVRDVRADVVPVRVVRDGVLVVRPVVPVVRDAAVSVRADGRAASSMPSPSRRRARWATMVPTPMAAATGHSTRPNTASAPSAP